MRLKPMKWGICMAINFLRRRLHLPSLSFTLKNLILLLAALFLFTFSGGAQEEDSRNYFVHQDASDNFLIFQKLEWNAGSHIKWYEISLEMFEDATSTWVPVNNAISAEHTNVILGSIPELIAEGIYKSQENHITVCLRAKESGEPQKYRYAVTSYNLLGQKSFSTEYTEFEINKAYIPEIERVSPALIYLDTIYDPSIRVTGENLRVNTDYYLFNDKKILRPLEIIRDDNNRRADVVFDPRTFDTGNWFLRAENPGGFIADSPITIKFMKWYDLSLSLGYSPLAIVHDQNIPTYYFTNFMPLGLDIRGTFIFLKKRAGYFGVSINGKWNAVTGSSSSYGINTHLAHTFLAFTYRYPIIRNRLTVEARVGGGFTYALATMFSFGQNLTSEPFSAIYPAVTAGVSIAGYAWRGLYIEAGADFMTSFSPDMIIMSIAPTVSVGWTL